MKNKKKKIKTQKQVQYHLSLSPRVSFVAYAWCLLGPYPFTSSSSSGSTSPPFFFLSFSPFSRGVKLAFETYCKAFCICNIL